jgi:hypothetical protein
MHCEVWRPSSFSQLGASFADSIAIGNWRLVVWGSVAAAAFSDDVGCLQAHALVGIGMWHCAMPAWQQAITGAVGALALGSPQRAAASLVVASEVANMPMARIPATVMRRAWMIPLAWRFDLIWLGNEVRYVRWRAFLSRLYNKYPFFTRFRQ